jgi:hypothetical protein
MYHLGHPEPDTHQQHAVYPYEKATCRLGVRDGCDGDLI